MRLAFRSVVTYAAIVAATLIAAPNRLAAQSPPTLTVTPTSVAPGGIVTVTLSNGPGNTNDWVGLYSSSAPNTMMLDWKYLNGTRVAPAAGATGATVTFMMPGTLGTYNVRFFSKDTYVLLATSATITVQSAAPNATITVTPTTTGPGGQVTATVANGPANARDWVGMYAVGAPDTLMIDWKYMTGSHTPPAAGAASWSVTFSMPTTAGSYNLRFFSNDTLSLLATSATVTVQNAAGGATVTVTPPSVAPGNPVNATIANGPGNARDWVGLYQAGAGNASYVAWKYLNGLQTPPAAGTASATVTFTTALSAGSYNVRLFTSDSYTLIATSPNFIVDGTAPTVSIAAPAANASVSGTVNVTANAADNSGVAGVQFKLDGANLGGEVLSAPYSIAWDTTAAAAGAHALSAVARDAAGNKTASAAVSVNVTNGVVTPPVISAVAASAIDTSSATITWTTNVGTDSNVDYGLTAAYGSIGPYDPALVTTHRTTLAGLSANTTYHFRVRSRDGMGNAVASGDFTFTTMQAGVGGNIINVPAGGDLQGAINRANPGDTILLAPGATYIGNFMLPVKNGSSMITIRSGAPDASLPAPNTRIDPSYAPVLPKLQSVNSSPALYTAPGAHHYTLMGLEFPATFQGFYIIVQLGDGSSAQNTLASVPHDLVLDRVYVHGDVTYGQKCGIAMNSASTTVMNSYVSEIKALGQDSQAIGGTNGPGPFTITNNYLEAAGENIMFGGADPSIPNLIPSDITVRGNYLAKQVAWRGQSWSVKNIFELKNAQRVIVDGNVFEYNWIGGQAGYAIVFTPRNQDGNCPWCTVQQVQFTNNLVRHTSSGINMLGTDNNHVSGVLTAITVSNNLFEDVSSATWGGAGRFVQIGAGAVNVTIDHNTVFQDGTSALYGYGAPMSGFVFTNNIIPDNSWMIMGDGVAPGNSTIATYFPGAVFRDNIFAGANPGIYPANNYFPASMSAVGFVNLAGGNYRLSAGSPYRNAATDGADVGCNIDTLDAAAKIKY